MAFNQIQINMKKNNLFILLLVLIVIIAGIWYFTMNKNTANGPNSNATTTVQSGTTQQAQSQPCETILSDDGTKVECDGPTCKGIKNDCYLYRRRIPKKPAPKGFDTAWYKVPSGTFKNDSFQYKCNCEKKP